MYTPKSPIEKGEGPYFPSIDKSRWVWFRQVSLDVAFSISLQKRDEYIVFLEDDVTPTQNVLGKLEHALQLFTKNQEWHLLNLYSTTPWVFEADTLSIHPTTFHCCTQAFVLNIGFGRRIATYIVDNKNKMPSDLLISTLKCNVTMNDAWWPPLNRTLFDDAYFMKTYEVVPSLFQHTPTTSTQGGNVFATHTSPSFIP
jgi:GR25 family glycosyltransferase involved in LPS biosynthesis